METSNLTENVPAAPIVVQDTTPATSPTAHQPMPLQPISVTNDSTRYTLSRFPFPPFLVRFSSGDMLLSHVKKELVLFCKQTHQIDIQILNCRSFRSTKNTHEYDFLLYLNDAQSFSSLLDINHWPLLIKNQHFLLPSLPSVPPQLSLLVKNVNLTINFNDFCPDIKSPYPNKKCHSYEKQISKSY